MSLSKNPAAYSDVAAILSTARAANGAIIPFSTAAEAIRWRSRAYQYRRLLPPGPWEDLYIKVEGASAIVTFRAPITHIMSLDGAAIPVQAAPTSEDDLLKIARGLLDEA